jgi:hypothetical protein
VWEAGQAKRCSLQLPTQRCNSSITIVPYHNEVSSVAQVLRTVQHASLRHLDLSTREGTEEEWQELATVLMKPCFAQLNSLKVKVYLCDIACDVAWDALIPVEKMAAFRWSVR